MPRKSLENRIKKIEATFASIKKAYPDPVYIGGVTFDKLYSLLFEDERKQMRKIIDAAEEKHLSNDQKSTWKSLVTAARERHDKGLKLVRRIRSMNERYSEMIQRQKAGENIYYGDIDFYEEILLEIGPEEE